MAQISHLQDALAVFEAGHNPFTDQQKQRLATVRSEADLQELLARDTELALSLNRALALAAFQSALGEAHTRLTQIVSGHVKMEIIPGISNANLRQIFFDYGEVVQLEPNEVLMEMGQSGDAVYMVEEGTLQVDFSGGQDVLGPGAIVGEIAVLEERPRTATVSAMTQVRLRKLEAIDFRRHISSRTKQGVQHLVAARKQEAWPAVTIHGDQVHLINVDGGYSRLLTRMMSEDFIRNQIFGMMGINKSDEIKVEDIQFGGRGTIKYVVRLQVRVNGTQKVIGIRFTETKKYKNAADANYWANDEVEHFKAFEKEGAAAIHIAGYVEAGKDFEDKDLLFLTSGVAGFSIGEFIVINDSDLVGDTGVRLEHLSELIATVVEGWLLRQGHNSRKPDTGPIIGDLKLENFVFNENKKAGEQVQYIDLGCVSWVPFGEMVNWLEYFLQKLDGPTPTQKKEALREGVAKGQATYARKKGLKPGGGGPGTCGPKSILGDLPLTIHTGTPDLVFEDPADLDKGVPKTLPHHSFWRFGVSALPFALRTPRAAGRSFASI